MLLTDKRIIKPDTVWVTDEEDAAINAAIASDPDTRDCGDITEG